jgi:hypothetical protein
MGAARRGSMHSSAQCSIRLLQQRGSRTTGLAVRLGQVVEGIGSCWRISRYEARSTGLPSLSSVPDGSCSSVALSVCFHREVRLIPRPNHWCRQRAFHRFWPTQCNTCCGLHSTAKLHARNKGVSDNGMPDIAEVLVGENCGGDRIDTRNTFPATSGACTATRQLKGPLHLS